MGMDQDLQLKQAEKVQIAVTPIKVTVINASKYLKDKVTDEYIRDVVVKALEKQVKEDFAPAWGITAELDFIGYDNGKKFSEAIKCSSYVKGRWWLVLLDTSHEAGLRGFHSVTEEGLPTGKVFAKSDNDYRRNWTASASHELLEMLVDPGMNLTALRPTGETTGQLYSYEVCDPCDADEYPIKVDGGMVQVANFVYPAWFEQFHKAETNTKFMHDDSRTVKEPFKLRPGGHATVLDIPSVAGWRQIFEDFEQGATPPYDVRYRLHPPVGSRRHQRILGSFERRDPRIPTG